MTQFSLPWPGVAPGDGVDGGPYTAPQWWGRIVALLSSSGMVEATVPLRSDLARANLGVLVNIGNLLAITNPANHDIQIDTGAAVVDGTVHYNDTALTLTIPLPTVNPRIDRIVVRKNYSAAQYDPDGDAGDEEVPAYTARITRLVGAEAAIPAAPALTQDTTRGTYWDIPLAQFQISTAGVITNLTSEAEYAPGWTDDHHSPDVAYGVYHPLYRTTATDAVQADSGGNARGDYAIDLQQQRAIAASVASGESSFVANLNNIASGKGSSSLGNGTTASGAASLAIGSKTSASGSGSFASGSTTTASGDYSHAEGELTTASGDYSHAEGSGCTASGTASHAEGLSSTASGDYAHADGYQATAQGDYSHAAGRRAKTGANNGVFIFADSEDADFTADRADQFKVRASGGTHLVQNAAAAALPVLELEQNDVDEPFIEFDGTSAADQTKSISTVNGDGVVTGPKNFSASAGWSFVGMVRISINGSDYWMPYYEPDTS